MDLLIVESVLLMKIHILKPPVFYTRLLLILLVFTPFSSSGIEVLHQLMSNCVCVYVECCIAFGDWTVIRIVRRFIML